MEEMTARKNLEQEYDSKVQHLKAVMEAKQKEIEHISHKVQLPVD